MGRRPKLYVPLTVTFFEDDRIIAAGDGPTLLYLAMCLRCKVMGTDGRLKESHIARLHRRRWQAELERLAELELVLFDRSTDEWFVAGWFGHNEAISQLDARREADRLRKAAGRAESDGIPGGFQPGSAPKGREGKGRKGRDARPHLFLDNGSGACGRCQLPPANAVHLRVVEDAS